MHAKSTLEIGDMVIEERSAGCLNWVKDGKTPIEGRYVGPCDPK